MKAGTFGEPPASLLFLLSSLAAAALFRALLRCFGVADGFCYGLISGLTGNLLLVALRKTAEEAWVVDQEVLEQGNGVGR